MAEMAKERSVKVSWKRAPPGEPAPTEQALSDFFMNFGSVVNVKVKETAGLVLFAEGADARGAVAHCNDPEGAPPLAPASWDVSQLVGVGAASPFSPSSAASMSPARGSSAATPHGGGGGGEAGEEAGEADDAAGNGEEGGGNAADEATFGFARGGARIRQRARAHAKLLELKMLIAQFYLDQVCTVSNGQ